MAKKTSAESAAKKAEKQRANNKALRSAVKGRVVQALKAIQGKDAAAAAGAVKAASSEIDKAVKRNVYHRNAGARRKSRLAKKLNALNAAAGQSAPADKK